MLWKYPNVYSYYNVYRMFKINRNEGTKIMKYIELTYKNNKETRKIIVFINAIHYIYRSRGETYLVFNQGSVCVNETIEQVKAIIDDALRV